MKQFSRVHEDISLRANREIGVLMLGEALVAKMKFVHGRVNLFHIALLAFEISLVSCSKPVS